MPDLLQSLQKHDIGFLRITASLWGVELTASSVEAAGRELALSMLDPNLVGETIASLSSEARRALAALVEAGGKIPWAVFTRQYGEVRDAGPGRRDREQVFLHPASAVEVLFYRSLLANAFFDTPAGLQEFAYISDDLLPLVRQAARAHDASQGADLTLELPGRPATPRERQHTLPASDRILDEAVTLLAAMRIGIEPPASGIPVDVLANFLRCAGILAGDDPSPEKVKAFLEMPPPAALALLAEAWQASDSFNELRQLPGLVCEGEWQNAPLLTRRLLLDLLAGIPPERWWSLPAFLNAVKERHPDFQRPVGDYDSWFIRRVTDGAYLRGFSAWDEVDGALIRHLVTGPLFWLSRVDLACAREGGEVTAFRLRAKPETSRQNGRLTVSSAGKVVIPRLAPRLVRYQVARFCEWEQPRADEFHYRVTAASLERAGGQGLKVSQLLRLLAKNSATELPPAFVKALKRWETRGTEARVVTQVVLRVSRPEVLEELRRSKAGRFLAEALGPTAVIIKPGAEPRVLSALAELGILAEQVAGMEEGKEKAAA